MGLAVQALPDEATPKKKRGRKPLPPEERRSIQVGCTLTEAERDRIMSAAAREERSLSEFLRVAALNIAEHGFIEHVTGG